MQNHAIILEVTNTTRLHIADSATPRSEVVRKISSDTGKSREERLGFGQTTKTRVPVTVDTDTGPATRMSSVPVINANLFRGRLRRIIADMIMDSLRERGMGVSVDTIHLLTCLASSGSPSSAKNIANAMKSNDPAKFFKSKDAEPKSGEFKSQDYRTEYLQAQTSDPFVALFGGGPNLWKSRLITPDLMPDIADLQQPHLINSKYAGVFGRPAMSLYASALTELVGTVRTDDVFTNSRHQDPESKDLQAWITIEADNANKTESKTNLRNMMVVEVVRAGTPFIGEIIIKNQDVNENIFEVMKGLVLIALNELKTEQLGGYVRNGWGKVNVNIAEGSDSEAIHKATEYISKVTVKDLMEAFGVAFR